MDAAGRGYNLSRQDNGRRVRGLAMRRHHVGFVLAALCLLVVAALAGCGVVPDQATSTSERLTVSFIDVGKGDCILVEAGSEAALIDTGYEDTADDVLSYLRKQGVDQLRCIILTHYDRDHVGGLRALAEALPVAEVCLPNYEGGDKNYRGVMDVVSGLGLNAGQATADTAYQLGDATLTVIPTSLTYQIEPGEEEGNDNDLSLVVALTHGADSYLFAGDLEKEGIAAYLDGAHGTFDVLKMPHHGRKSGKTDDLIEAVGPRIAVITDSEDDPADKKTLGYLENVDADIYRTSTDGTVVVESDGAANYAVTTER